MLSVRDAVYKSFKAKSQRAIRLHSCESIFIIFVPSYVNSSRQNRFKCCNLHDLIYIFLDNGVMNTPKRRFLSFAFTVLCFKKSRLIRILILKQHQIFKIPISINFTNPLRKTIYLQIYLKITQKFTKRPKT